MWIWNLQSFQILWQTICIIHVVRTYLFMWTPLKLSWRHSEEKNIWQNKPLGFHYGDCFRLVAWTRLVLEIKKETAICILSRALQDLPHVSLLFFSGVIFFLTKMLKGNKMFIKKVRDELLSTQALQLQRGWFHLMLMNPINAWGQWCLWSGLYGQPSSTSVVCHIVW